MPKILSIKQVNNSTQPLPLTFETNLSRPLFSAPGAAPNPAEWDVSVIRFRIPNFYVPLFNFVDGRYTMTARYLSLSVTEPMIYQPWSTGVSGQPVYNVQHFILMLNNLIASVCAALPAPTTDYPRFEYDEETELLSYIANKNYFATDGSLANPVYLSCNPALSQIIDGLPIYYNPIQGDELMVFDTGSNLSGNYYTMVSQNSIAEHIIDYARLILMSNIPTDNEVIGVSNDVNTQNNLTQVGLPVLMDFTPEELTIHNYNNYIVYNAITPYRQVSINTNLSFDNIQIYVYYETVMAGLQRIEVPPGTSADIKLMFTEKKKNKFA
jgi:hypothetical protein